MPIIIPDRPRLTHLSFCVCLSTMNLFMLLCLLSFLLCAFFLILILGKRAHACYILNYECHKPSKDRTLDAEVGGNLMRQSKNLGKEEFMFLLRIMTNSGIGEETYAPRNVFEGRAQSATHEDALLEMDEFFYDTLDNLFSKSKISPTDIDILVVNVSTFIPAPSLTARIVNHYKMREDIKSFNLSGMGCSGSVISLNLVENLFKCHTNSLALILTTESIAPHWYLGTDRSMMLPNLLFRSGGTSILLTNNPALTHKAMFKLKHLVRSHLAADDDAYHCIHQIEDENGYRGVSLSKRLAKTAAKAIGVNFRELAPKIVSIRELVRYVCLKQFGRKVPVINFKTGVDHFIIHTGGKDVIEGIGKYLELNDYDLEPSRMTLYRFGNTSASSIWYVLAYMEAKKRLKKGDIVLMINPGGGFKCNSFTLEVARDLQGHDNVWKDCIDNYPERSQTKLNPFQEKFAWINDDLDPVTIKRLLEDDDYWKECMSRNPPGPSIHDS